MYVIVYHSSTLSSSPAKNVWPEGNWTLQIDQNPATDKILLPDCSNLFSVFCHENHNLKVASPNTHLRILLLYKKGN